MSLIIADLESRPGSAGISSSINSVLDRWIADYETDRPTKVEIRDGKVWVTLADGRVIANPLDWHTWLAHASPAQQANVELHVFSVDWPELDEGLDIQGMLLGIRPKTPESEPIDS